MKYLIINADEYGLTEGVNAAIVDCVKAGVVTSTTAIVNGLAFQQMARHIPVFHDKGTSVGLHFNLTLGEPTADSLPGLVDGEGRLLPRKWLLLKSMTRHISSSEVAKELSAQWNRLIDAGITPSHIDGHEHVHILPGVRQVVLNFAAKHHIPVRLPMEQRIVTGSLRPAGCRLLLRKQVARVLSRRLCSQMKQAGVWSPSNFFSVFSVVNNVTPDAATYEAIFQRLPGGVSELMCHPASHEPTLCRYSRIADQNFRECEFLLSETFRKLLHQYDVTPVSYTQAKSLTCQGGPMW